MLIGILGLTLTITSQTSNGTTKRSLDTITNSLTKVRQLTLRLLTLALDVLLSTLLLEVLVSQKTANSLLSTADGLIPLTLGAVGVVFGRCARGADGERTSLCGSVREVRLGGALALGFVCFGLAWC
jgi:hypothetical protein